MNSRPAAQVQAEDDVKLFFILLLPYSQSILEPNLANLSSSQTPTELLPKLFGPLRERYLYRPGGYTRVLRIEPQKKDQAPSAILELVDGPRDMRFEMTAQTLASERAGGRDMHNVTMKNVKKVTQFKQNGWEKLKKEVKQLESRQRSKRASQNKQEEEEEED